MLRSVRVANLRAIGPEGVSLDLAPLTLLVGPNGAGKSSILQGICLLAQSARNPARIGLVPEGHLIALDDREAALYHGRREDIPIRIGIEWAPSGSDEPIGAWLEVTGAGPNTPGKWRQGLTRGSASVTFGPSTDKKLSGDVAAMQGEIKATVSVSMIGQFLGDGIFMPTSNTHDPAASASLIRWQGVARELVEWFRSPDLRYIGPIRGGALFQTTAQGKATTVGANGEGAIQVLSLAYTRGAPARKKVLSRWAERFGLPELSAGYAGEGQLEARFSDPLNGTSLDVRSAGFGSQQALPILADLAELSPGSTLLVEEIEHSSHPAWLRLWGETLVEAATELGVQILVTTHAPDLVLAVGLALRSKRVKPDSAITYEVVRGPKGVSTQRRTFDSLGAVQGGWIESFASAERELLGSLMTGANGEKKGRRKTAAR